MDRTLRPGRAALSARLLLALAVLVTAGAPACSGPASRWGDDAPDPSRAEVPLPAQAGWRASLVLDNGGVGVWTVGTADVWTQHGTPDVFALDDEGRCLFLMSYSGKWTPYHTVEDRAWLGAFSEVDLDPRRPGHEFYTGGQRGRLYQIRAYPDRSFDHDVIARFPGQEIHTLVAGDLLPARPGNELLAFTLLGAVYDVRPADETGFRFAAPLLADVDARVRQALLLPAAPGEDADAAPRIVATGRSGELMLLRMTENGLRGDVILREPMGLGRLALRHTLRDTAAGEPAVVYVTRDDGLVLRVAEGPDGWRREAIYAGPQGPRGLAAGRFHADPDLESVAVFGYSRRVQLLTRDGSGGDWRVETIFEDVDKGHWLSAAELDGRNATDELLASGYSGRVVLLARPPGYGLGDVPTDPDPDGPYGR